MKSPLYLLTILLPLATELAFASPTVDVEDTDVLEERDRGDGGGSGGHFPGKGSACKVFKPYWYYKYPCDSSDKFGRENPGGTFTATCKYNNWYKTKKGWTQEYNRPRNCHGYWENQRCPPPTFGY